MGEIYVMIQPVQYFVYLIFELKFQTLDQMGVIIMSVQNDISRCLYQFIDIKKNNIIYGKLSASVYVQNIYFMNLYYFVFLQNTRPFTHEH